jgi:hypothetical protein
MPAGVNVLNATLSDALPSPVAGTFVVTASVEAEMDAANLGAFIVNVMSALPADAVVQSGSLTFGP